MRTMGSNMRALFEEYGRCDDLCEILADECTRRHIDEISRNPRVDVEEVRSIKYLHEFDRYVIPSIVLIDRGSDLDSCRALQGPTWGYPTEGAYYRDASSVDSLLAVRVPLLGINAEDDPVRQLLQGSGGVKTERSQISVKEAIPFLEFTRNPYTVLCTTSLGGHLSWFETGGGRWFARAVS